MDEPLHTDSSTAPKKEHETKKKPAAHNASPVRAIGEDDDGYDPYTDWHDRRIREPLFERDPWA